MPKNPILIDVVRSFIAENKEPGPDLPHGTAALFKKLYAVVPAI